MFSESDEFSIFWVSPQFITAFYFQAVTLEFTNPTNVLSRVGPTKLQKFYLYMLEFVQENLALVSIVPFYMQ